MERESPDAGSSKAIADQLEQQYQLRFSGQQQYRDAVWKILAKHYFQKWIPTEGAVLDLGCGWGEFIRNISAREKYAMDLNPDSERHLGGIRFLQQDCSQRWQLPSESLDAVFTSNFLEHLPSKQALSSTLTQAWRCLKSGGRIICLGPNINALNGRYWDFWDHYVPLSDLSLSEALRLHGFQIRTSIRKFLPYTMSLGKPPPAFLVRVYLKLPLLWRISGKQFLVVAEK